MGTAQIRIIDLKFRQFARQLQYSMIALVLMSFWVSRALAQDDHSQHQELTPNQQNQQSQQSQQSALIKIVREATARFHDVKIAEYEGYRLEFGCVSGPDSV